MTGLVIISTGAWMHTEFYVNITATTITDASNAIQHKFFNAIQLYNSSVLRAFAFKEGLSFLMPYGDKFETISVL